MAEAVTPKTLKQEWEERNGKRSAVLTRAEEYAEWTQPALFPRTGTNETVELQNEKDSIGSKGVNHLSNRVIDVLFPAPPRTFFRLELDDELKEKALTIMTAAAKGNAKQAEQELAKATTDLDTKLAAKERQAIKFMDTLMYRPAAIMLAKLLIVTGNGMIYHPPKNKPVQVYSFRDYLVVRDLSGEVILIMLKETKAFETFRPEVQQALQAGKAGTKYEPFSDITIYTKVELNAETGRFDVTQAAEEVKLDLNEASYTKADLPWIPLTWDLIRGENYGRGLVEQYAGAFHAINVLTGAILNIAAIMGDIKIFVDPVSNIDIDAVNKSLPGTYHSGRADEVSAFMLEKLNELQALMSMIDRYEKLLSQAFLLNSQAVRNAERVTAEEIRAMAQELETSHGGIYSRLATQWQSPTAKIILQQIGFTGVLLGDKQLIVPRVITGMESLSRLGELDSIRLFLMDLQLLNTVPEDVRAVMHLGRFITVLGTNRQIEYTKFLKTDAEIQADQAQALAMQQAMVAQEQAGKTQTAVASAAVKES